MPEYSETSLAYHLLHVVFTVPGYLIAELFELLEKKFANSPSFLDFIFQCGNVLSSVKHHLMPWDMRWFRRGFIPEGNINCLLAYIKHVFDKTVIDCCPVEAGFFSLKEYSKAVIDGKTFI